MTPTKKLSGLFLSAEELKAMTDWPEPVIEARLSMADSLELLVIELNKIADELNV